VRLYAEEDFLQRPEFTDPEILRTNLASVILQMKLWRVGEIEEFPFLTRPDQRFINDGYRLLQEIGALDDEKQLTATGKNVARIPLDPRLARAVIESTRFACVNEVQIICAFLSIQDPRERPFDWQQAADESHARFADKKSDLAAVLNLWRYVDDKMKHLSKTQFRKLCKKEFLAFTRLLEWRDIVHQLKEIAADLNFTKGRPGNDYDAIHKSMLAGFASHIALHSEKFEYQGTRGRNLFLFPGSGLGKQPPKWILATEIQETTRVFARFAAAINPAWAEEVCPHLVSSEQFEPYWDSKKKMVMGYERLSMFGLTVLPRRKILFERFQPEQSREIFIRQALLAELEHPKLPFIARNRELLRQVHQWEIMTRRHDLLLDERYYFDFYEAVLPTEVCSLQSLLQWYESLDDSKQLLLLMAVKDVVADESRVPAADQYPAQVQISGTDYPLSYVFDLGSEDDGVSVTVPFYHLNAMDQTMLDWLVPGWAGEKVRCLLQTLSKPIRRSLPPVNGLLDEFAQEIAQGVPDQTLFDCMAAFVRRRYGLQISPASIDADKLPAWYHPKIIVTDDQGKHLAAGRDLQALRAELNLTDVIVEVQSETFRQQDNVTHWCFDDLPESIEINKGSDRLTLYPTLVDKGDGVQVTALADSEQAHDELFYGLRRLFRVYLQEKINYATRQVPDIRKLCLLYHDFASCEELLDDMVTAVIDDTCLSDYNAIRTEAKFSACANQASSGFIASFTALKNQVLEILTSYQDLQNEIHGLNIDVFHDAVEDLTYQLSLLVYSGFVLLTPREWLQRIPVYLQAISRRLDKLRTGGLSADQQIQNEIAPLQQFLDSVYADDTHPLHGTTEIDDFHWSLQELRLSLYAQELKTRFPVSVKRLKKQQASLESVYVHSGY
jgi:ATP-dependent helicase HrpA